MGRKEGIIKEVENGLGVFGHILNWFDNGVLSTVSMMPTVGFKGLCVYGMMGAFLRGEALRR